MIDLSPFTLNRFEYEQAHQYYLPPHIWTILQGGKSVFLLGSRGTGKTTLLKALNWAEQLANQQLRQQLGVEFGAGHYLGIYVKLSLFQLGPFRTWPDGDDFLRGSVISMYIDLLWSESVYAALAQLLARRIMHAAPAKEFENVSSLIRLHPKLLANQQKTSRISFAALKDLLYQRRRELETFALAKIPIQPQELAAIFPLPQIGEFGRTVADLATSFLASCTDNQPWQIKACFDEAECLDAFQQRIFNTGARLGTAALAYIVSYVRPVEEPIDTVLPNISLQRADREILRLDTITDSEFLDLVEGVSRVRITSCKPENTIPFNTVQILGRLDINGLLWDMLKASEDREAARLLALAEDLRRAYEDLEEMSPAATTQKKPPPIYQAYILDRLRLELPTPDMPKARRAQDSAEMRKRMVAAYLCICAELGSRVRYASADMVLQMSDKCVRDFLLQMDEVYRHTGLSIDRFVTAVVSVAIQDDALRIASTKKREYVPESGVGSPTETLRLVEGLATLTARLQTTRYKQIGLRSSERGIFGLDVASAGDRPEMVRTLRLIGEAGDAGFFKILKRTDREWRFRLHSSLAAAFGFSYRGAYYPVNIRLSDLVSLYSEGDADKRKALVARLESWFGTDQSAELSLFEDPKP